MLVRANVSLSKARAVAGISNTAHCAQCRIWRVVELGLHKSNTMSGHKISRSQKHFALASGTLDAGIGACILHFIVRGAELPIFVIIFASGLTAWGLWQVFAGAFGSPRQVRMAAYGVDWEN